jgi:hypothetical protein
MKPDNLRTAALPEMALHGLADIPAKLVKRFGLGKDGLPEGSGGQTAIWGLFDNENDLIHA